MTTGKPRAAKMDRRTVARLDAAVIECTDFERKESYKVLIEDLKEVGITVTFDQIEKSVHRLGLKWRDVFLPATRLERGHPDARANDAKPNTTGQGPDMRAVLDRIEQLHQQAQEQAQLAKDRAAAMRADVKKTLEICGDGMTSEEFAAELQARGYAVASNDLCDDGNWTLWVKG